jgi:hypothetical protein
LKEPPPQQNFDTTMNHYKAMEVALSSKQFDEAYNIAEQVHHSTMMENKESGASILCECSEGCMADKNFEDEVSQDENEKLKKILQKKEEETLIAEVLASLLKKLKETYPNKK